MYTPTITDSAHLYLPRSAAADLLAARTLLAQLEQAEQDSADTGVLSPFTPAPLSVTALLTTDGLAYEVLLKNMQAAVRLREQIAILPPWAERVLVLRDFQGCSLAELARTINSSPTEARRMHDRARQLLWARLAEGAPEAG